jgi:hypothetical protein
MSECHDGFWLYDNTQGLNLGMRAKTAEAALLEALQYYQRRLTSVEKQYAELDKKVESFLCQFRTEEENEEY